MKKPLSFLLVFLLCVAVAKAQTLPQGLNKKDKAGKREGAWTIWLTKNSKPTQNKDSVVYYREITYELGTPVGLVKDFYLTGKTKWEGYLVTDQTEDVRNGKSIWYDKDGNKTEEAQFNRVGRKISSTLFNKAIEPGDSISRVYAQASIDFQRGNYTKALVSFEEVRKLTEKKFGPKHLSYAGMLNTLSLYYQTAGSFEKAETYALESVQIYRTQLGENNPTYASVLGSLAMFYVTAGKYEKAEPLLIQGLQQLKTQNIARASLLNTLAALYMRMGRCENAEPLLLEALYSCQLNEFYPVYTTYLNNLADVYVCMDKDQKAEPLMIRALQLDKQLHSESPSYAVSLLNLGTFYSRVGKLAKGESFLREALPIIGKQMGENNLRYSIALSNLGVLYSRMDKFEQAESLFRQALQIVVSTFGESSPNYSVCLRNLANLNVTIGKYEKAEPFYLKSNEDLLSQIDRYFPSLSEKEKEEFYQSVKEGFETFQSFAVLRYPFHPAISGEMFNMQLGTKALLLNNSAKWKQRIRTSGDKKLAALYYAWEDKQAFLARLYKETDPAKRKPIDSLQGEANALEKELSRRSEVFAQYADKRHYTWQDIQQKLMPGEAAIEIIRMRKSGIVKIITDSSATALTRYPRHGLTDTVYYAALIVTPKSKQPELVVLKNGNELEKHRLNYYRNCISTQKTDELSYDQFWKPIASALGKKTKKIYFSPDGVYNSINLNTLLNPKTKRYLLEEEDIQLLTSSKDLMAASKEENYNKLAYLFGYPNYQATKEKRAMLVEKERSAQPVYYALNIERGSDLADLPGTKTEVESIAAMLLAKGWEPEVLIEDKALEETLKDAFKPRVLHIATHGYFRPDSLLSAHTNPLLQSGLMLTGAGRTLAGDKDEKTEDGILTAYEAMNLNLDNTDLVVLSACETGLGEIRNGEGVYGLQRAFKVAGAKSIVMSLWKVNDDATEQLITNFYQFWLESGNKRDAFKKAQLSLQAKYPSPYFWGAFVMVGE